ncbi:phosphodiester glycosidase family protein [Janthinobacterium sp.]|uniref:phosphodiester glycosidase family protein n=1 Tax=Janthinobacterium sp. TaxID=1871054 RepID=UPI0026273B02|nr:phosphodiester glycosidase family protein [Janthinobacterium sp.]
MAMPQAAAGAVELPRKRLQPLIASQPDTILLRTPAAAPYVFRSYHDSDTSSPTFGTELCVLEASSSTSRLLVRHLARDTGAASVFESAFPSQAFAILNGGFFGVDSQGKPTPIGLSKAAGTLWSRAMPWTSGGYIAAGPLAPHIFSVGERKQLASYTNILQSKPILVWQGKEGIRRATADRFDRSAVATDRHGHIFFFLLHQPENGAASLAEFSFLLLQYRSSHGTSIDTALAMDGGPGAHLYIPAINRHCGTGNAPYTPNALYLQAMQ